MLRRILKFAAGLSLALCLLSTFLWIRSGVSTDAINVFTGPTEYFVVSDHGEIQWQSHTTLNFADQLPAATKEF